MAQLLGRDATWARVTTLGRHRVEDLPGGAPGATRSFVTFAIRPDPGSAPSATVTVPFFLGPKDFDKLRAADPQLVRAVDFGMFAFIVVPLYQALGAVRSSVRGYASGGWAPGDEAEAELGVAIDLLESASDADYAPNLQSFVDKGCNVIVTVGFLLADATKAAAEANPGVQFAIVDSNTSAPNVQGLTFATDQPSFLAGYMAAATTKTGIVGTFGGINIPPVAIFMQGFAKGVEYYNAQKGASVKVLGWDMAKQDGTFAGNFNNLDDGKNIAKSQADEGADIIFPVAGPVGLGASAYAMESGGKVKIIGVDVDMTKSNPEQAEVYVASVLKKIDAAVLQSVKDALAGQGGEALAMGDQALHQHQQNRHAQQRHGIGRRHFDPRRVAEELEKLRRHHVEARRNGDHRGRRE